YFRDDPRDHTGCSPSELAALPTFRGSAELRSEPVPWRVLVPRMLPMIAVYFCYGWTLWLYLNWLPSFFKRRFDLDLKRSTVFSAGVFFAGVIGDVAGGWLSDAILRRTHNIVLARSRLVCGSMMLSLLSLVPVLFLNDLTLIAICLSAAFFFLEITI